MHRRLALGLASCGMTKRKKQGYESKRRKRQTGEETGRGTDGGGIEAWSWEER